MENDPKRDVYFFAVDHCTALQVSPSIGASVSKFFSETVLEKFP